MNISNDISAQQLFDAATSGVWAQGQASTIGSTCAYRGTKGTKCAVGQVIPDQFYNKGMENRSIESLVIYVKNRSHLGADCQSWFAKLAAHEGMLASLQCAHDTLSMSPNLTKIQFRAHWLLAIKNVAYRYGLVFNPDLYVDTARDHG